MSGKWWAARELSQSRRVGVLSLLREVAAHDGVAALNQDGLWAVGGELPGDVAGDVAVLHVGFEVEASAGENPIRAYGQARIGAGEATLELCVAPAQRRNGLGRELLAELTRGLEQHVPVEQGTDLHAATDRMPRGNEPEGSAPASAPPTSTLELNAWAHGNLPGAQGLAAAASWRPARTLYRMERTSLEPLDLDLPPGFTASTLAAAANPGASTQTGTESSTEASTETGTEASTETSTESSTETSIAGWLAVNAAAFEHHPEQGSFSRADLELRRNEPWFDASGVFLVREAAAAASAINDQTTPPTQPRYPEKYEGIVAFHWVKREPGAPVGEVYVVGVAPEAQGQGLAKPLTALGVNYLLAQGVQRVDLYVDESNVRAVATYESLGFAVATADAQYLPNYLPNFLPN